MNSDLKVGDVVRLRAGSLVLVNYRKVASVEPDEKECVIEALRPFGPGAEDDHFEAGLVADVRPLMVDGTYSAGADVWTIALSGDFDPKYIHADLEVTRVMVKTFVDRGF